MAETLFVIPLTNEPQTFEVELSGRPLIMTNKWNQECSAWELSIQDANTLTNLISGLPIVTGIDLLYQFSHLGISGSLIAYTEGEELMPPTLDNLGEQGRLYYLVDQ